MAEENSKQQSSLTTSEAAAAEILAPDSTRNLFQEVLDEVSETRLDQAKAVIKERVLEIKRLEKLLAKAKADLQKLLEKDPEEIALF